MEAKLPSVGRPIGVALTVVTCAFVAAYLWRAAEQRALDDATDAALRSVVSEARFRIDEPMRALVHFARHWESHPSSHSGWDAEASRLAADFGYIQTIEWVDAWMHVRRIAPLEGHETAVEFDPGFEEQRRNTLIAARESRSVVATGPIGLIQGGTGILFCVPLHSQGEVGGFMLAVFRANDLLDEALRNVAPDFAISVRDGEDTLYERSISAAGGSNRSAPLQRYNLRWTAQVTPGPRIVAAYLTWLPGIVLLGGTLNAFFFGLALHLAQRDRTRAATLLGANARLSAEISGRERAERAEREAQEELTSVLSSLPDHIWSARVGDDGKLDIRYYSAVVEQISGLSPGWFEEEPARWIEIIHPADRERVTESYRLTVGGSVDAHAIDYRIERSDGETRWVRDRLRATMVDGSRRLDGVITDISETKGAEETRLALEASLREAQKLESLGVLAGGVAHDFNNLMTGVLGNAHLALDDLPADAPARSRIDRIERAARAAADLCRQMLAYAGRGSLVTETLDVSQLVEDIGELLAASTARKIAIRYALVRHASPIRADASQIRQVVMNLITNAAEAIGDDSGGTIEVSTRTLELASEDCTGTLEAGPHLELRVSDDGAGMDEETHRRIFEPFFSRKFTGRGLGMAAVQGIVHAHGGGISVESELGRGTTVTVLFPALPEETASPRASKARALSWRGHGTVLLIDDELDAREVGQQVLERAGLKVLTAESGEQGLELFGAHAADITCVLLDLTMPGMDGLETYRRLHDIDPPVPVVLCSGYPEHAALERFADEGLAGFLEKPYDPADMLERVRDAIEQPPTRPRVTPAAGPAHRGRA